MRVTVKLFAVAKDVAGAESMVVEVPEPATVGALRAALAAEVPALEAILRGALFAVDTAYADDAEVIHSPAAEVACIPPVSGG